MLLSKRALKTVIAVMFWVVIWQLAVLLANRNLIIWIPGPIQTLQALCRLSKEKMFWHSVFYSVWRIFKGYVLAVICGSACAFLSSKSSVFRMLTSPVIRTVRAVPVASFIILVFLWLSKNVIPTFIAFLMVFPIVWDNIEGGLLQIDKQLIEMADVMGLSKKQILKEITFPSLMPSISTAVIGGLGFAWKSGVAAEIIARTEFSIGNMLWVSKNAIDYDEVFALTLVIVILSFLLENVLKLFLRKWQK